MNAKGKRPLVGWVLYDFANSAFATTVLAVIYNLHFTKVVAGGFELDLPIGRISIPGAAMWSLVVAISTAIVAISSPILGAMADQASLRRRMLIFYCYLGVFFTIGLSWVDAGDILLGSVIFIIANFGFAGGNVFYNAFLLDVSHRKSLGRVSGIAWGLGYLGGGLCLALNLIMLNKPHWLGFPDGTFDVGDCMIVAGCWWGLFALPTMLWLRDKKPTEPGISLTKLARDGWHRISNTLREVRRYKQLVRFLIAYLIFNDGIETIIIMATPFGAQVVGMEVSELVAFFIMIQATAFVGSLFFGWLADKIGNRKTLLITIFVWIIVVGWAYRIGWLVGVREDYYIIGILAGLVLGGSQSAARSMQALFTPSDRSAEFFGFYAVSGRFSSILGPLIFFWIILITGGIREGILSLGIFFLIGGAILWSVNEKEGMTAAVGNN